MFFLARKIYRHFSSTCGIHTIQHPLKALFIDPEKPFKELVFSMLPLLIQLKGSQE
jgi:hypothetical protein